MDGTVLRSWHELKEGLTNSPDTGEARTAEDLRRWAVGQFGSGADRVTVALGRLAEPGPSPVDGADHAVGVLTGHYSGLPELWIYPFEGIEITRAMRDAGEAPACLSELRLPT